ncbi:transketolase [Piromyces finnis]|uniref:Transketolase n=1 Tax=Piromyces finnis TaxID=1754191 RepID=A0A1Y1VDK7_9FUNG|nr:transketolase [Piromyces finnis]|eukprot:ORX52961.1 transketolase [Piromyces finnis]
MVNQTFGDIDKLAVNTIRCLSIDMVQKANSGHPGAPMGCAPMSHVLFTRHFKANPTDSNWLARDRFVLSNGHASALQYSIYHLLGYNISMQDLKDFRQYKSKTPGHPEVGMTEGVEVTTGPLGQGISNAVGLAIAEAHLAKTFNRGDYKIFDNYTYVICGDGCLEEGINYEAASLAGHYKLGKLIVLYDANGIQIDGDVEIAFTENVCKRFEAQGWHVQEVADGNNDLEAISKAIEAAKAETTKPSLIRINTTIGYGSQNQGTEKVHGAPLGNADVAFSKKSLGFNPEEFFVVPEEVQKLYNDICQSGMDAQKEWTRMYEKYSEEYPELAAEIERRKQNKLKEGWEEKLPRFTANDAGAATRKLSHDVLNIVCNELPEIVGGSADLSGSNLTQWKGSVDFQADASGLGSYDGRYFHFGVREHVMAAIMNGIHAYRFGFIPFGSTFLNFINYASGAVRLSALSKHQVLYIMTHDSIGLGEDGPTHQPVEIIPNLRAYPNLFVMRPADGNEVSGCYMKAIKSRTTPTVLCLTRQGVPQLEGSSIEKTLKGGYILSEPETTPKVILVGTGSEVSLCVESAKILNNEGIATRVVSLPCWEIFDEQSEEYRESVFPKNIPVLSVEAASTFGWSKYATASCGIDDFGVSAPASQVYKHFGLVPEVVVEKAKKLL